MSAQLYFQFNRKLVRGWDRGRDTVFSLVINLIKLFSTRRIGAILPRVETSKRTDTIRSEHLKATVLNLQSFKRNFIFQ